MKVLSLFCCLFFFLNLTVTAQLRLAYNPAHEPVDYAAGRLSEQFLQQGTSLLTVDGSSLSSLPDIWVISQDSVPALCQPYLSQHDFDTLQQEGYNFRWVNNHKLLLLVARDPVGAAYGLLELAEFVQSGRKFTDMPARMVNPHKAYRIIKFNLPWSPYRPGPATEIHTQVCRDLKFWERFLDMMVENRFNVLSLWNNHPFPYMIRATRFPEATPFDEQEMQEWKNFWSTLFRMARQRGIQTFIVNWNIVVSPEFARAYGAEEYGDRSELVRQYTRESVTQLINEYPDMTGIGVTLADWMGTFDGKMSPQEREDWIEETFVAGMKAAERPVKFLHRSVLAGDPMAMRRLLDRADLPEPALVEIKFNWSHGHSTPTLAITHDYHSGELDERFWKPMPDNYRIQWMVRNEDFFILRWGQPDFIRQHIYTNDHEYVNGYFIGSEGFIPAVDYAQKLSPEQTWQYAFEKHWLFYKMWGRLLYSPATDDSVFEAAFEQRYGEGVGEPMLQAFRLASQMPLRLASFHRSTWDFTLYAEGFLEASPSDPQGVFDSISPFISVHEFIEHETLDPDMLSIPAFVTLQLQDKEVPAGKISPLALADASEQDSRMALQKVEELSTHVDQFSGALNSELQDLVTWSYLGLYFSEKLRAGVALHKFKVTGEESCRQQAVAHLKKGLIHWDEVIAHTRDRYRATPHVSSRDYDESFQLFSWELMRPQVVRDISLAEEMEVK